MIIQSLNSFDAFKTLCTDDEVLTEVDGSSVYAGYVNDNIYISAPHIRIIINKKDFDRAIKHEKGIIIKGYMFRFYKHIGIV